MKTLTIIILLFAGTVSAQDSTKVLNVSFQARVIEFLAPQVCYPENDEGFNVFLKWRSSIRASRITGNTVIVTDTIPTVILASFYKYALANPDGMGVSALIKTQIAAKRSANSYLNALCTEYEQTYATMLIERRILGRRLLLGK